MLTTGNQLRAARALVDMDQTTLATAAGLHKNSVVSMEKQGAGTLTSGLNVVLAVMRVLESEGVEFLNHGQPGVRLRRRAMTYEEFELPIKRFASDELPNLLTGWNIERPSLRKDNNVYLLTINEGREQLGRIAFDGEGPDYWPKPQGLSSRPDRITPHDLRSWVSQCCGDYINRNR